MELFIFKRVNLVEHCLFSKKAWFFGNFSFIFEKSGHFFHNFLDPSIWDLLQCTLLIFGTLYIRFTTAHLIANFLDHSTYMSFTTAKFFDRILKNERIWQIMNEKTENFVTKLEASSFKKYTSYFSRQKSGSIIFH